jgi:hypothetical protein
LPTKLTVEKIHEPTEIKNYLTGFKGPERREREEKERGCGSSGESERNYLSEHTISLSDEARCRLARVGEEREENGHEENGQEFYERISSHNIYMCRRRRSLLIQIIHI